MDLGIGDPAAGTGAQETSGGEEGLFGDAGSFGDLPDQTKEILPEIEDVVDDDKSELNIPKIEEDAQNDLGNLTLISSRPRDYSTEPQCLVEWRRKQEERIKSKDEEEARRKQELREKARQELESW